MRFYHWLLSLLAFAVFTSDASPLGDRSLFSSYSDTGSRSFILRSQTTPPPACNATQTSAPHPGSLVAKRTAASASITASGWSDLCTACGISDLSITNLCFNLGQDGWGYALSAVADACVQQNVADEMISFSKIPGILNSDDIMSYAISYRQVPREAVSVLGVVPSTLYCMIPPINPELNGIVNEQPAGVSPGLFGSPSVSVVPFGSDGTCPYGSSPDVSTCACTGTTVSDTVPNPVNVTNGTNITTCETCFTSGNSTATPIPGNTNSTTTGDSIVSNSTLTGNTYANFTSTGNTYANSTSTGSTASNSTLTGSNSTNGTVADTNSTLTSSDSTLNGTYTTNSTLSGNITASNTSGSTSTLTSTDTPGAGISTSTSINVGSATASATTTMNAGTDSIEASITSAASADTATGTSGVTFDGNIHDPAGR
ncbi:hypothetical protein J3R30DRAFT_3695322 [Lentinula aciculospora]|uniref:Uncharacterized protein n=1 Tax=Lentinula aciculospora TaxID=153920 RepID=A0A9W9DV04_9AGAR|nr:hypothetical protein J3R30DRAFT_3695322 [Lentinula aciculospora]